MTNEFNPSVLENVSNLASPLKKSTNYSALFSLAKEEFDISTEDETEPQKSDQNFSPNKRHSKSDESILKWPHKRRPSKSAGEDVIKKSVHFTPPQKSKESLECGKPCTLGAAKPLRSRRSSSRKNDAQSKDLNTSALNGTTDENEIIIDSSRRARESQESKKTTRTEKKSNLVSNGLQESVLSQASKGSTILENVQSQSQGSDNEYVESSQTTTSSNLRRRLSICRNSLKNNSLLALDTQQNLSPEKHEDEHNFSLTISSESESRTSIREKSFTPPSNSESKSRPDSQNEQSNSPPKTNDQKSEKSKTEFNTSSPLKGLSQELESCINNREYEQFTDDILTTELFERPSFTFETIDLLNEYTDNNQTTSNDILSKILSSPDNDPTREEPIDDDFKNANCEIEEKDPLRIDENEPNPGPTSPEKGEKYNSKKLSLKRKFSIHNSIENVDPTSPKRRRSTRKKSEESKSNTNTLDKYLVKRNEKIVSENSIKDRINLRRNSESKDSQMSEVSRRRRSSRLQTVLQDDLSDLDDLPDLAVTAAEVSSKVEAMMKKEIFSERIIKKLGNMRIKLRHKPLPQHKIETRAGSKAITYEMQKKFVKFAPLNKELYNAKEDAIIKRNWVNFCEDHDWNPKNSKPFLLFKHGDRFLLTSLEERRKFVQYLANDLSNRPLCSVYSRFKILYGKPEFINMRYTREEDMQILAYMLYTPVEHADKKCSELAMVLHRSRESIWKRYHKLTDKYRQDDVDKNIKVEWNRSLIEKYISILLDVTVSDDIYELKDAFIPIVVWTEMQKKINISDKELKNFWDFQLHMQLFAPEPIYMNRIKILLIKYMYAKEIHDFSEIKWSNVALNFEGYTKHFLRRAFHHLVGQGSYKLRSRNLKNIIAWLHEEKIDQLMEEPDDKWLPRLNYKNKKIQLREEDVQLLQYLK